MSSIVFDFLSPELTNIPKFLKGTLDANFNNALCNGITWLFLIWIILYVCHDKLINVLLKPPKYPKYLRSRLSSSVWDLCIHMGFLLSYYSHITNKYPDSASPELKFFEHQQDSVSSLERCTFACLCSCLLANGCIQGVQRSFLCLVKFAALTIACSSAYILGFVDLCFTLAALSAFTGMFEDLIRLFLSLVYKKGESSRFFIDSMFGASLVLFCTVYFYVIPLACLIPLGSMRFSGNADVMRLALFISLLCWINLVIYKSPLLNLVFHQLYHSKKSRREYLETVSLSTDNGKQCHSMALVCLGSVLECSLFPPRSDDGFLMALLRSEEKKRKRQVNARRRPRNKYMIIEALKCILAMKKKLSQKLKRFISEESSEDSESDSHTILDSDSDDSSTSQDFVSEVRHYSEMMERQSQSEEDTLPLEDEEASIMNHSLEMSISHESVEDVADLGRLDEPHQTENVGKFEAGTAAMASCIDACKLQEPSGSSERSGRNEENSKEDAAAYKRITDVLSFCQHIDDC